jgi:hypothetical protein
MPDREFTTFGQLADALEEAAAAVPVALRGALKHEATLLRALIIAHASGRPGPNIITGKYIASWKVVPRPLVAGGVVTVGTMKPQGRRLEYGFADTDSIGRVYNQPPFPHVQPSIDVWEPGVQEALRKAVEAVL